MFVTVVTAVTANGDRHTLCFVTSHGVFCDGPNGVVPRMIIAGLRRAAVQAVFYAAFEVCGTGEVIAPSPRRTSFLVEAKSL